MMKFFRFSRSIFKQVQYCRSDKCLLPDNNHLLSYVTHAVNFYSYYKSILEIFPNNVFFSFSLYNQVQQILGSSKSGDFQFVWFPMRSASRMKLASRLRFARLTSWPVEYWLEYSVLEQVIVLFLRLNVWLSVVKTVI